MVYGSIPWKEHSWEHDKNNLLTIRIKCHLYKSCSACYNQFEARDIMAVSDDKSESSLKKYRKKPSKTRFHEMSTTLTSALIDDVDENENSFSSDTALPVVEPENIEIDGEIFVNDTDFVHLMQAEGTNLPLIELQDQNLNPTVGELTVTGY